MIHKSSVPHFKNLINKKFNQLFVIDHFGWNKEKRKTYWLACCECGNLVLTTTRSLLSNIKRSCGCKTLEEVFNRKLNKYINKKSGRLSIIDYLYNDGRNEYWLCVCDCGNLTKISISHFLSKHTRSCGCLHKESCSKRAILRNKKMVGNKSPRWNKNISKTDRLLGQRRDWNPKNHKWRKKVYKRDNFTCQKCFDNRGHNLTAHHIKPYSLYFRLRYVVSNGITLCKKCHKKFHKKFGIKNVNLNTLIDFFST